MASIKVFSAILLILVISTKGYCQQCSISDIKVGITQTGKQVEGSPEWLTTITNNCKCPQSNVYVKCTGFNSYEPVDPAVFKTEGDSCLINSGKPIAQGVPVTFTFAFKTPFDLTPIKSSIDSC